MERKKKIVLLVFFVTVFFMLPVSSILADISLRGNPGIEYVSAVLRIPEEMKNLSENTTITDPIYFLDIALKTTKHSAKYINGTLSFKENLQDLSIVNGIRVNNNLTITKDFTVWSNMQVAEVKNAANPFVIVGLSHRPEKISFILELQSVNSYDDKAYSETLEFTILTSQTTIDITSISNPADYYKGYKVPVTVYVKNTGSYDTSGYLEVRVSIKSTKAGTYLSTPFENDDGAVILTDVKTFSVTIAPQQTKSVYFQIDYSDYSIGAMNIGEWKICQVLVDAGNAIDVVDESHPDFAQHISDPYFRIHVRTESMQPHPVFIYYLWNSGGTGDNWGGTNPKNYFINGWGTVKAGLWRFQTYDSNIPVALKMILCYDDSSWSIPSDLSDSRPIFDHGREYAGDQLNLVDSIWDDTNFCSKWNCGFDILLMAASRDVSYSGGLAVYCRAIACKSGPSTPGAAWQVNIDGVVQHCIAHIYECEDYPDHPKKFCVMCYSASWPWFDYIHEISALPWAKQSNVFCTAIGDHYCQHHFNEEWDRFYTVVQ